MLVIYATYQEESICEQTTIIGIAEDRNAAFKLIGKFLSSKKNIEPKIDYSFYTSTIGNDGLACSPVFWYAY